MAATENKVRFNLKNVHYALLNSTTQAITFDTPVPVPGAVSLTLDPAGEMKPFYADGITFYVSESNNGYTGSLEMARFTDKMLQDVWGYEKAPTDNVLIEKSGVEAKPFALLFQIDGDKDNELYCLYNVTGSRPSIASATNTDTKEPTTQTTSITAPPLPDNRVMARTSAETPAETKKNWFNKVYEKGAAAL